MDEWAELGQLGGRAADYLLAMGIGGGLDIETVLGRELLGVLAVGTIGYLVDAAAQRGLEDEAIALLARLIPEPV